MNRSTYQYSLGTSENVIVNSLQQQQNPPNFAVYRYFEKQLFEIGSRKDIVPEPLPAVVHVPPLSSLRLVVRLPSPPISLSQLPSFSLTWCLLDSLHGDKIRRGELVINHPQHTVSDVPNRLCEQPPLRINCTVLGRDWNQLLSTTTVKVREFIDIEVRVRLAAKVSSEKLDLEIVIAIFNREAFVENSPGTHRDYIASGTMHKKLVVDVRELLLEEGKAVKVHRIRVCFLRQGVYSIHPLFRLKPMDANAKNCWWQSTEKHLLFVYDDMR